MSTRRTNAVEPKWLLVFAFFIAGSFFGGLAIYLYANAAHPASVKLHLPAGTYQYINPTLATEPAANYSNFSTVSKDLELKVNGLITDARNHGEVSDAAMYFRDFEPGTWLAVNANMQFSPGVLLKVPIMIAYYRLAEIQPSVLDEQIIFDGTLVLPHEDIFSTLSPMVPGQTYTVKDLLARMINTSDETAAALLFTHIDKQKLNEIFSDLGIDFTEDTEHRDFISLKRYSLFYRVLYNANYLSPDYSEKALAFLADTNTPSLLQKNLPQAVSFVHRVSGRVFTQASISMTEAYECDIVYYPKHNYLLCAVAQGKTRATIENLFSQIGMAIYDDVSYRYGE